MHGFKRQFAQAPRPAVAKRAPGRQSDQAIGLELGTEPEPVARLCLNRGERAGPMTPSY
jgi:hypothetical protein